MKKSVTKKKITFMPGGNICEFTGRPTVLEVAIDNALPLNHSCGGMGSCTTCRIRVKRGLEKIPPPEDVEKEHAQMRGFKPYERLACQIEAFDGLVVEIPGEEESEPQDIF